MSRLFEKQQVSNLNKLNKLEIQTNLSILAKFLKFCSRHFENKWLAGCLYVGASE